ncbi:hypothetical protein CGK93_10985 [Arthrobacter sp. YN]|nr:hypothetical protein CGK93_10985 [Arthrobacter sp. YN]
MPGPEIPKLLVSESFENAVALWAWFRSESEQCLHPKNNAVTWVQIVEDKKLMMGGLASGLSRGQCEARSTNDCLLSKVRYRGASRRAQAASPFARFCNVMSPVGQIRIKV